MITSQKHLFNIPEDIVYLNCAYMSPQLRSVSEAGRAGAARKEQPWLISAEDFFTESETTRGLFAELINARADDIAIIPAASYGVAIAAANIQMQAGSKIVVLDEQFPSNVYPWREAARDSGAKVHTVARPADDDWTQALLSAIDAKTAVVAVPNCHWTDGSFIDLVKIGKHCRETHTALVVDATQSLGAFPFSVAEIQPDFIIAASYKWLFGPYSLGFLYVSPAYQNGRPIEHNWIARENSQDFAGLVNYRDEFQKGARRYDVGERSNFALMPMAAAGLQQILEWQVPSIAATLSGMTEQIASRATDLDLSVAPSHLRSGHLLGVRFPGGVPTELVTKLSQNNVYVSVRGNSIRISPHVYNSQQDLDKLFEVLASAL